MYNNFPKNQKFFFNFYAFFEKSCILCERFRKMTGIFVLVNLKNQSLCLYKRQMADGVGANPGKFTRQKPKRKHKAAPHTRPDTVKSQQQTKRNRELSELPIFPYLCCVFLPSYRPQRYFDRPAGIRPGGVFVYIIRFPLYLDIRVLNPLRDTQGNREQFPTRGKRRVFHRPSNHKMLFGFFLLMFPSLFPFRSFQNLSGQCVWRRGPTAIHDFGYWSPFQFAVRITTAIPV